MGNCHFVAIAACDRNRTIGKDGKIPWHYSNDLKRFKEITLNNPIIMGRKTYESLSRKEGLPHRINIIMTHNRDYVAPEPCVTLYSLDEVLQYIKDQDFTIVFIIGGSEIYKLFLENDLLNYISLSVVPDIIDGGDAFFPECDGDKWKPIIKEDLGENVTRYMYIRKQV